MVKPFQFSRLPAINFGSGKIKVLPGLIRRYGKSIILATAKGSFMNSTYAGYLFESFRNEGITYNHVIIPGEPSPEMIDSITGRFADVAADAVVAIGGGSVLDAGKAVSAMIRVPGSVKEYLEGVGTREHPGTKLPFIAIPTTSGTGSEATKNAVISRVGKEGFKKSLRHDNFVPDFAIVDPELTLTCPKAVTAAGGMDCFTQLTESYLSDKSSEYTDALAWEGLGAIKTSLVQSYQNGDDINARTGMSFAALTSGICLANAGLGVVHGFASSIGGMFNVPHGVVCGTLMAQANAVTVRVMRRGRIDAAVMNKYVRLGKLFLGSDGKPDEYYVDGFIEYLLKLSDELDLPLLGKYGISGEDIEPVCRVTELKNNPVKLGLEDLIEILSSRL